MWTRLAALWSMLAVYNPSPGWVLQDLSKKYPKAEAQLKSLTNEEREMVALDCAVVKLCHETARSYDSQDINCVPMLMALNTLDRGCRNVAGDNQTFSQLGIRLKQAQMHCTLWSEPNCQGRSTKVRHIVIEDVDSKTPVRSVGCLSPPPCCKEKSPMGTYDAPDLYTGFDSGAILFFEFPLYRGACEKVKLHSNQTFEGSSLKTKSVMVTKETHCTVFYKPGSRVDTPKEIPIGGMNIDATQISKINCSV